MFLFLPPFCPLFGNLIYSFYSFFFLSSFFNYDVCLNVLFVLGSTVIIESSGGHRSYGEFVLLALQTIYNKIVYYLDTGVEASSRKTRGYNHSSTASLKLEQENKPKQDSRAIILS